MVTGFPPDGRPLSDMGLPAGVDRIDAAFVWGYNGRVYLVSGYAYWKMETDGRAVVRDDYPRDMSMWGGVPIPLDDAVTMPRPHGTTYFLQGNYYWEFNDARMRVRDRYPKIINEELLKLNCSRERSLSDEPRHVFDSDHHSNGRKMLQQASSLIFLCLPFLSLYHSNR